MRCDCSTAYMHQAPARRLHPSPPHPEPPNPTHTAAIALIGLALLLEAAQAFVPVSPLNNIHARSSRPSSGSRRGASALVMKAGRVRFDLEIDRVVDGLGRIESITSVRPTDGSISRIQSRPIIDSPNPPPPPRIPHTRQMAIKPGSMVALVTPMKPDGAIDEQQLRDLLRWHVACETDGVVVLGTTGEVSGWVLFACVCGLGWVVHGVFGSILSVIVFCSHPNNINTSQCYRPRRSPSRSARACWTSPRRR